MVISESEFREVIASKGCRMHGALVIFVARSRGFMRGRAGKRGNRETREDGEAGLRALRIT